MSVSLARRHNADRGRRQRTHHRRIRLHCDFHHQAPANEKPKPITPIEIGANLSHDMAGRPFRRIVKIVKAGCPTRPIPKPMPNRPLEWHIERRGDCCFAHVSVPSRFRPTPQIGVTGRNARANLAVSHCHASRCRSGNRRAASRSVAGRYRGMGARISVLSRGRTEADDDAHGRRLSWCASSSNRSHCNRPRRNSHSPQRAGNGWGNRPDVLCHR